MPIDRYVSRFPVLYLNCLMDQSISANVTLSITPTAAVTRSVHDQRRSVTDQLVSSPLNREILRLICFNRFELK